MEYANWFVVVMGVGIVFFGLIVLIVAVTIMGKILGNRGGTAVNAAGVATTVGAGDGRALPGGAVSGGDPINDMANDKGLLAAVSAAIADDMGTDVSGIKIHSIRKIV